MAHPTPHPATPRQKQIQQHISKPKGGKPGGGVMKKSVTAPLTYGEALRASRGEAAQEYGPVITALKGQSRGDAIREKQIANWYGQVAQSIKEGAERDAAAYATGESSLTAQNAAAGTQNQQMLAAQAAQDAATAKTLGASPTNLDYAAAGNTALAQQRATLSAPLAAAGAAQIGYAGQEVTAAHERGIQGVAEEAQRHNKIIEELSKEQHDQGYLQQKDLQLLRESERKFSVEMAALGPKAAQEYGAAAASRAHAGLYGAQTHRVPSEEARNYGAAAANRAKAQYGGFTPAQSHAIEERHNNAISAAHSLYWSIEPAKRPKTSAQWNSFTQLVETTKETPPNLAAWAVEQLRKRVG